MAFDWQAIAEKSVKKLERRGLLRNLTPGERKSALQIVGEVAVHEFNRHIDEACAKHQPKEKE
jgi:hypothetical protein